jgi:pimeloyl-ACP methyl ester carboxylesterase
MNAALTRIGTDIEQLEIEVPEAAVARLNHRLRRARADGEGWEASLVYGARPELVAGLLDHWCDDFDFLAVERHLNELSPWRVQGQGRSLAFLHARSRRSDARPLLWLHGYSSSLVELLHVVTALTSPTAASQPAFHVIAPSLPGFGLSVSAEPTARAVARECAALLDVLGYERYALHGSDVGARIAEELAGEEPERVTSLHVTSLASRPSSDPFELAALDRADKSRLASLSELRGTWQHAAPDNAVERLALAACQLGDSESVELAPLRDSLLAGLTLSELGGDAVAQRLLARPGARQRERGQSPVCVCAFPLATPTLRGAATRDHAAIAWHEHERGGELAALEQPLVLVDSLRRFHASLEV